MGKRGQRPKGKVQIKWSPRFAYAVGLLVSDGSLSKNGRHISLVSKDIEQLENFQNALKISVNIGKNLNGNKNNEVNRIQFSDVLFYNFLFSIGVMPNKSKIVGKIAVPSKYFFHFLRGSFDGDGSIHSYVDKRWKSSFMFYTIFASASPSYIAWLQDEIHKYLNIKGHVTKSGKNSTYQLKYAKNDSLPLLRAMYPKKDVFCLSRKRLKIQEILRIIGERL